MSDLKDFHKELLYLLKELDTICSKQNIKYSLFAGTLIGAIRHKGFVPWDDDADVVFERREYDKFINNLPSEFTIDVDTWVTRFSHKNNPKIYVDIFVFDRTSNSKILRNLHVISLKALQGTLKSKVTKGKGLISGFFSYALHIIGLPFFKSFKLKVYNKFAVIFKHKKSGYMFSSLDKFEYIGKFLPDTILKSYSKVDFEGVELMILDGYDFYLREFYGDYMQLPKIEDRIPEHGDFRKKMKPE